ncbi:hypothetical protein [Streptomyces sp. NPDC021224]|uniref:hypothetical protein n=1 Tax=unclassified Streptomyces TaxID=2593676 RepID=UPI0037B42B57
MLSAASILAAFTPARAAGSGGSLYNCPYGKFCVYPQGQNPPVSPLLGGVYSGYGTHYLTNNPPGKSWIVNNQVSGAKAVICEDYNANCVLTLNSGESAYYDLALINFVELVQP